MVLGGGRRFAIHENAELSPTGLLFLVFLRLKRTSKRFRTEVLAQRS